MIATYLVALVVLRWTYFGRDVYAVGGNIAAARLSGINVARTMIIVYAIAGLCAGIGGVIQAGRLGAASPLVGETMPLDAAAAVLLGGTSFLGGVGGVTGTAVGVLFIGTLQNGLSIAARLELLAAGRDGRDPDPRRRDRPAPASSGRAPAQAQGLRARPDVDVRTEARGGKSVVTASPYFADQTYTAASREVLDSRQNAGAPVAGRARPSRTGRTRRSRPIRSSRSGSANAWRSGSRTIRSWRC